jgi:3-dehydroquinate dehydratase-2
VRIAAVHGPNLNLLGQREPDVYGSDSLDQVNAALAGLGAELGTEVEWFQSNHEGGLVDFVQQAAQRVDGFVVNAGGYTHTSVALRDALAAVARPFVEVHISNVFAREHFRHRSLLAGVAVGVVSGFGINSYRLGLRALVDFLRQGGPPGPRAQGD